MAVGDEVSTSLVRPRGRMALPTQGASVERSGIHEFDPDAGRDAYDAYTVHVNVSDAPIRWRSVLRSNRQCAAAPGTTVALSM